MKVLAWLTAGWFMFGITGLAGASPMYYTFEGEVTSLQEGSTGFPFNPITVGTVFSYTFLVDFDEHGFVERYDGTTLTTPFIDDHIDYFYADFLSESILTSDYDLAFTTTGNTSERNVGYIDPAVYYEDPPNNPTNSYTAQLFGGSTSHFVEFQTLETYAFSIGKEWMLNEFLHGTNFSRDGFYATMTLTEISSVPIPSTVWLFGSGLIGLVGIARRKANA